MVDAKTSDVNERPPFDQELLDIANYMQAYTVKSQEAFHMARLCLMDALGCAVLALRNPECTKLLGPLIPNSIIPFGTRVPGTAYIVDPMEGAFNIGAQIRWVDFNDTWLAAEWGHPSDNLGGILAIADYQSQMNVSQGKKPLLMQAVLTAMIKAYEIQGMLALKNSFNRVGLDHVLLVKVATTAVVTHLLGGSPIHIAAALSQAWIDGHSLRTYRHAPNVGTRKSWAAGDATRRGVQLAMMSLKGEMGYPSALSAKTWGFYDVFLKGKKLDIPEPYGCKVIENILFKVPFATEAHAQTAVECTLRLRESVKNRLLDIKKITLYTHESAIRIISKTGKLYNSADRDHCIQYIIAVALIFGEVSVEHYEDKIASDPRIDTLRSKIEVLEDKSYSQDYRDPEKRSIANALQIEFEDGSTTEKIAVEYPLGHPKRRKEGEPAILKKFADNLSSHYSAAQTHKILELCQDQAKLEQTPVNEFMQLWVI